MNFSTVKGRVREITRDDSNAPTVSDASLLLYANFALDWISSKHPKVNVEELPVTNYRVTLPVNTVGIEALFSDTLEYSRTDSYIPDSGYYTVLGSTQIRLVDDEEEVTLVYQGGYTHLVDDTSVVPLPTRLQEGWFLYIVSRALAQLAVDSGDIGQWRTDTDAGNPEHNPLLELSQHYEEMATRAINIPTGL